MKFFTKLFFLLVCTLSLFFSCSDQDDFDSIAINTSSPNIFQFSYRGQLYSSPYEGNLEDGDIVLTDTNVSKLYKQIKDEQALYSLQNESDFIEYFDNEEDYSARMCQILIEVPVSSIRSSAVTLVSAGGGKKWTIIKTSDPNNSNRYHFQVTGNDATIHYNSMIRNQFPDIFGNYGLTYFYSFIYTVSYDDGIVKSVDYDQNLLKVVTNNINSSGGTSMEEYTFSMKYYEVKSNTNQLLESSISGAPEIDFWMEFYPNERKSDRTGGRGVTGRIN